MNRCIVIFIACFALLISCHSNREKLNDYVLVRTTLDSIVVKFNNSNKEIKEIYDDLEYYEELNDFQKKINLKRFEEIKNNLPEVFDRIIKAKKIFIEKIENGGDKELFNIAIDYLNTIQKLEPLTDDLYDKIYKDINGIETKELKSVLELGISIQKKSTRISDFMDDYYEINKFDKSEH